MNWNMSEGANDEDYPTLPRNPPCRNINFFRESQSSEATGFARNDGGISAHGHGTLSTGGDIRPIGRGRGTGSSRTVSDGDAHATSGRGGSQVPPTGNRVGRGVRRGHGGTIGPGSSFHAPRTVIDVDENVNLHDEDGGMAAGNKDMCDKAIWNANNTIIFCDICIEEITAGNTSNGFLTARAYKNMVEKYFHSSGLRHSKIQLKNRWDQLKKLYAFWLWLNKQTRHGTIFDDDEFWKKHAKADCIIQCTC